MLIMSIQNILGKKMASMIIVGMVFGVLFSIIIYYIIVFIYNLYKNIKINNRRKKIKIVK